MANYVTVIGINKLQGAIREVRNHVGDSPSGRRRLMNKMGLAMRNASRQNITTQGEGKWAPLSRWTRAKTGRRKALITLRERIKHDYNADQARVYFEQSSPFWNLDTHHFGRTSAGVRNTPMRIPLPRNSGQIAGAGLRILIFNRRASRIPARPVWASKKQIQAEGEKQIANWLEELRRKVQT